MEKKQEFRVYRGAIGGIEMEIKVKVNADIAVVYALAVTERGGASAVSTPSMVANRAEAPPRFANIRLF